MPFGNIPACKGKLDILSCVYLLTEGFYDLESFPLLQGWRPVSIVAGHTEPQEGARPGEKVPGEVTEVRGQGQVTK